MITALRLDFPLFRLLRNVSLLLLVFGLLAGLNSPVSRAASASPVPGVQYFDITGHNVVGLFLQNFYAGGGLTTTGLPLTEEFKDTSGMTIQVFERAILELHQPVDGNDGGQQVPYIQRKLLGALLTEGRNFPPAKPEAGKDNWRFYEATQHNLSGRFARYWDSNGGLSVFGYPLSEELTEANPADGKTYTVQYFERARFEYHPELAGTAYEVQLGLLGRQYAEGKYDPGLYDRVKPLAAGPQQLVKIPSLMYHHIRNLTAPYNSELNNYSVTPDALVEQLDWLKANGYHTVTISQIADYLKYGIPLPEKPVNLRFDDGWTNQLFAAQELKKRGMTATFFVITQATRYPYLTPEQLKQLDKDGFEVASHTRNHPFLTRNGADYDWNQISGSKLDLEKLLGHPVRSFAYPYGDLNSGVMSQVQRAGYDVAVGVGWSLFWRANKMFAEPTISVSNVRTLSEFIRRLNINY
jgi:peptidoglycan/xylan/chitin deacetylase (PgdA/CDA1 family)